jgi:hypothetical protein
LGTSNWQNISYNIDLVKKLNPKSILDIGVGFGRWGILFREFLEVWGDRNYSGKWNRLIDGVEIFPGYIKPYHNYFYDNIFIENALDFLRRTEAKYELINCGDVVEHFEKTEAFELIELCLAKSKYVLINVPEGSNWEQGAINNNEYERHRSTWHKTDFNKFENVLIKEFNDIELRNYIVVLIAKEKINLTGAYGKYFSIKNILKNKLGLGWLVNLTGKKNG